MDASLQNALISWVNTFCQKSSVSALVDEVITSGSVLGDITERIFGAGAEPCPADTEERFDYVVSGLAEYYQLSGDLLVNVTDITQGSLNAIGKVLMLLLSWAVHCHQNEVFIADIRTLSPEDQHCLMLLINSTMKQMGDGSLSAGNFTVGLDCYAGTAQQPGSSAVTTACSATSPDGVLGSVHTPQPTDDPMASPVLDDSVIGQPGRTPASTSPHRVDYNQSPASHCTGTLARMEFEAKMNPTPVSRHKSRPMVSRGSVRFTPLSSQVPGTPQTASSCKHGGVWKNASPALRRWIASPAIARSASVSSTEVSAFATMAEEIQTVAKQSDGNTIQRQMSSVTYALREQIGLREDLEMQLRSTQEDLAKAETTARDSDRQCKAMEAQLAEMDDLRHVDMELKKTQSKLDRALKRLEAASDLKSHAEQLQQELTAARADYVAMETKLTESEDVAGRIEFYKAQLHGSELRYSTECARVEQLQAEVEKLSSLYGDSTKQSAAATSDVARMQGEIERLQEELEKANAGAGGEDCVQLLADSSEITRLRLENDELRSQLPTKEEMRLVKSQMEDALEMKKSFEKLYIETKRQLLEMADKRSAAEHRLAEAQEKETLTRQLLEAEQSTVITAQQQLKVTEESLASAVEETNRVCTTLNDTASTLKASKAQVNELQQQLVVSRHELQASNDAAANTKESLLGQLGDTRLELDSVKHLLQETSKKFSSLQASNDVQHEKFQEQRKHWQQLVHAANEKTNDANQMLEAARSTMATEQQQHHAAFVKLQAKYDEACVERQAAQQHLAAAKSQASTSLEEMQALQTQVAEQQACWDDLERQNSELEARLSEALQRSQKVQSSGDELVTSLQLKLSEQAETHHQMFAVVGQCTAEVLQKFSGVECKALDSEASITAHQQNIISLLKQLDEHHTETLSKQTALQAAADDWKQQASVKEKQVADDLSAARKELGSLQAEKTALQTALQEMETASNQLSLEKQELAEQVQSAVEVSSSRQQECAALQSSIRELQKQQSDVMAELATVKETASSLSQKLEAARSSALTEKDHYETTSSKLQARYDKACLEHQAAEQKLASVKNQAAVSAQELQSLQEQLAQQQAVQNDMELRNSQLEIQLNGALDRARDLETSGGEQATCLQKKLREQKEMHRVLLSDVSQQATLLLQSVTGSEWKPLDSEASITAHQQNIITLLKQLGEQHSESLSKQTALQAAADDWRQQVSVKEKEAADDLSAARKESESLQAEKEELQAAVQEMESAFNQVSSEKQELAEQVESVTKVSKSHQEECVALQSSVSELEKQQSETTANLTTARHTLTEQEELLEKRTADLEETSCTLQQSQRELEQLRIELDCQQHIHEEQVSALHEVEAGLRAQLAQREPDIAQVDLTEHTALQKKYTQLQNELHRMQIDLDIAVRRQSELVASETEATRFAEQTSANHRSLQEEMKDHLEQYTAEAEANKVKFRTVMAEARKREMQASVSNQRLVDELDAAQDHIKDQERHYKQMISTLEEQLKLLSQQLHSQRQHDSSQHQRDSLSGRYSLSQSKRMTQPGYEAVHQEFDEAQTPTQLDKLPSPINSLDGDISLYLAGANSKRVSMPARSNTSRKPAAKTTVSRPPFAWPDEDEEQSDDVDSDNSEERLRELRRRNTLAPSHLKSTYPIETQVAEGKVSEKELRQSLSGSKSRVSSVSRSSTRFHNMQTVTEEERPPTNFAPPAQPTSFSLEFSPPRKQTVAPRMVSKKRPAQVDDDEHAAKRRETFLIASPKPKESDRLNTRSAARSSSLARSGRTPPRAKPLPDRRSSPRFDTSPREQRETTKTQLPPRLAARMASHQRKAQEKAAAAVPASQPVSSKKAARPLKQRNRI